MTLSKTTEIHITLNTVNGPVVSTYKIYDVEDAKYIIDSYLKDGKTFTVTYS